MLNHTLAESPRPLQVETIPAESARTRKCLWLNFIGRRFTVVIPRGNFFGNESTQPLYGSINLATHRIRLSRNLSRRDRLAVLIHELRHAWQQEYGYPLEGPEPDAYDAQRFAMAVFRSIQDAGGLPALWSLRPHEVEDGSPAGIADRIVYEQLAEPFDDLVSFGRRVCEAFALQSKGGAK